VTGPGPEQSVAEIDLIYAHASTFPCRVKTIGETRWVMKLRGSGPGPMALATEFLALRAAAAMGLPVPEAQPLYLSPDFPWMIGTDEFDGIVQRSGGWNLGIAYIEHAATASLYDILGAEPHFLAALSDVDRALGNMDRSARNPNILAHGVTLTAIDFDACLFLRRLARGSVPATFPLPPGHLLEGAMVGSAPRHLDPEVLTEALREAPEQWTAAIPCGRDALEAGLVDFAKAWNQSH